MKGLIVYSISLFSASAVFAENKQKITTFILDNLHFSYPIIIAALKIFHFCGQNICLLQGRPCVSYNSS